MKIKKQLLDFERKGNKKSRLFRPLALSFCMLTFIGASAQTGRVNITMKNASVKELFQAIEKQTSYRFSYRDVEIQGKDGVTINANNEELRTILNRELAKYGLTYQVSGNKIIVTPIQQTKGEKKQITGKVIDTKGEPVIGATVMERGTTNGTITDFDGNFTLSVAEGTTIEISYIGFKTQQLLAKANKPMSVTLKEDTEVLDEVVVVGFGTQKKVNLTGAVSVISADEIKQRPVTNVTQALQGMIPGLQISQSNGSLEDTPSINVRGTTTIGEGTSGSPLVLIDGMEGDLNSIAPQDIESISVLKDAAASSIYGSRAPFGVILITTKSGTDEGKVTINYNNSFRWGSPINMNHMMNSVDFCSWINDTRTNGGEGVYFLPERMKQIVDYHNATPYGPGQRITSDGRILYAIAERSDGSGLWADGYSDGIDDVDYFDVIFKKWTFSQEHNVSISGGNKKLNYYASLNYLNQNGLINLGNEGLDRYNAMLKVSSDVTNWLKFNYSVRFIRKDYSKPTRLTSDLYHNMARQGWPVLPLYDRHGYYYSCPSPALGLAEGGTDRSQDDHIYHQASFVIEPIKNWKTHIDFNYHMNANNRHWDKQQLFNHDINGNPTVFEDDSNVHEDLNKINYYNFSAYTEYTHQWRDVHNMHIMGGFQAENLKNKIFGLQRDGIMFPDKPETDLTTGLGPNGDPITPGVNGSFNDWATAGFFARINYDYNGKYLLETNIRADGTSRFRADNRWKVFPSVSLGWNIARENFFESLNDVIETLKLRASVGALGNQNTDNWFQTYQIMKVESSKGNWLMNGKRPNTAFAPELVSTSLTWEKIQSYNIALDWAMLNNRLTGSLEFYIRDTKDMIGYAPELPHILGAKVPVTNNTDLRTLGWELSLGWRDRLSNGLSYGINFNLSDARAKITRYPNNPTNNIWSYIPGRYIGEIWGYTTKGLAKTDEEMQLHLSKLPNGGQDGLGSNWKAGDIMYEDINGDGKISSGAEVLGDSGDLSVIGNNTPRFLFGLDLNASWKGFDIRAFFQGVMKRDVWNGSNYMFGATNGGLWQANGIRNVNDYFRNEDTWSVQEGYASTNVDAYLPRPLFDSKNKNLQTQTRYLQNAAYIRLKNFQIGYTIPQEITTRWKIQNLRIYFSGENLWTLSGVDKQFDPETITGGYEIDGVGEGIGYPLSRTLSVGLNITL